MLRQVPNAITLFRGLVLTPAIAAIFVWHVFAVMGHVIDPGEYFPYRSWALILTLAAIVSDLLDGYLAKTYGWKSDFGARVDPLMDKFFSYVCLLAVPAFYGVGWYLIPFIPMALKTHLYSRRTSGMRKRREILEANEYARQKTGYLFGAQVAFMTAIAAEDVIHGDTLWYVANLVFVIGLASMAWSTILCEYAMEQYEEQVKRHHKERAQAADQHAGSMQPVS